MKWLQLDLVAGCESSDEPSESDAFALLDAIVEAAEDVGYVLCGTITVQEADEEEIHDDIRELCDRLIQRERGVTCQS